MARLTRRNMIKYSVFGLSTLVVSGGLVSCGGDDEAVIDMSFTHGVASGDPLSDRVIIWTRAVPVDSVTNTSLRVMFEVATDAGFSNIIRNGDAILNADTDFILKVDVTDLEPTTHYYYRFTSHGKTSLVGQTKTLPAEDAAVDQVKLAVFSCSNYPTGYFNAYAETLNLDGIDAVLHLGDYIYEYAMGGYGTENAEAIGRALPSDNAEEIVSLADYRKRYALYRSDAGLQTMHQQLPMIAVPDDHEVANDTYIDGAENHDSETQGDFFVRRMNALQAYFEWMPIRPASEGDNETFHRRFKWGSLVNLMMLDTRLTGRSKQLSLSSPEFFNADQSFNAEAFATALSDDSRSMLGADQLSWLTSQLADSSATWQVLGQQVLMGRMNLPLEVLLQLGGDINTVLAELVAIKLRVLQGAPTVTEQEQARLTAAAPYNLDAWDGYQYERELIFNSVVPSGQNLIVLAGDTHNAWANNLQTANGTNAGVEFATSSVTSPGLEGFLGLDVAGATALETGLGVLIDGLQYANFMDRGFMVLTFTPDDTEANWMYVDNIASTSYSMQTQRSKKMRVNTDENVLSELV